MGTAPTSDEDQTEAEDELDDSADARFWRTFRSFLRAALSAQRFPTTAEEDRAQLVAFEEFLDAARSAGLEPGLRHVAASVSYTHLTLPTTPYV